MTKTDIEEAFLDDSLDATVSKEERARVRTSATPAPQLLLVMECHRPTAGGARHSLAEADEVMIGRGKARALSRARLDTAGGRSARRLTLRLPDPLASATHVRLARTPAGWTVEDLGSKNGTLKNGRPLDGAPLADGDLLEVGQTIFMFRAAVPMLPDDAADRDSGALVPAAPGLATLIAPLERRFAALAEVARAEVPILVRGETGTGKELIARAVHALAQRGGRRGPFMAVNCGALPDTLIESELFGHRKGAFSGADEDRPGLVRSADGGTLFLDEIGDLAPQSQAALLRVLQEREVTPVGGVRAVPVDIRLVAATHHDLDARVASGRFRADLYGRIAGWTLELPPLRERREDLGLLVAALLAQHDGPEVTLSVEAGRALLAYPWPRNVRELSKTLAAAVALSGGHVELEHLPDELRRARTLVNDPLAVTVRERDLQADVSDVAPAREDELDASDLAIRAELTARLREHRGNISAVARVMGKDRVQIRRWARRFRLDLESFR